MLLVVNRPWKNLATNVLMDIAMNKFVDIAAKLILDDENDEDINVEKFQATHYLR